MDKLIEFVLTIFLQIRWRIALAAARGVASVGIDPFDVDFSHNCLDAVRRVAQLENIGVRRGWLNENDRTVHWHY
jgi:hypothetical protein